MTENTPGYMTGGWRDKYIITKANGNRLAPEAVYFVLRLDADPHARIAAMAYADSVEADNPVLANDISERVDAAFRAVLQDVCRKETPND